jgi:hypothetical protein
MIYDKEVSFPYPILSRLTDDYPDSNFEIVTHLYEEDLNYRIEITYNLNSSYLENLLNENKATIKVIVSSKDSKIYDVEHTTGLYSLRIKKNRLSLSNTLKIQLFIVSKADVNFRHNSEIDQFYKRYKKNINISKNNILAFSNVEKYDGNLRKPFDIIETKVDKNLKSEIKIELGTELITIIFKDKKYQLTEFSYNKSLKNHYVYIALQKVLMVMVKEIASRDEQIIVSDVNEEDLSELFRKMVGLLKNKGVSVVDFENIDEVINKITDKIIDKHYYAILKESDHYAS